MERGEGLEVARRSGIAGSGVEPGRSFPCLSFPEGRRSSVTPGGQVFWGCGLGAHAVCSAAWGWQELQRLSVLPERSPLPVPQFPRSCRPTPRCLRGCPGRAGGGRGALLPGAASGPAEAARGTVNTPHPFSSPCLSFGGRRVCVRVCGQGQGPP